jgi:hypothetical protein
MAGLEGVALISPGAGTIPRRLTDTLVMLPQYKE